MIYDLLIILSKIILIGVLMSGIIIGFNFLKKIFNRIVLFTNNYNTTNEIENKLLGIEEIIFNQYKNNGKFIPTLIYLLLFIITFTIIIIMINNLYMIGQNSGFWFAIKILIAIIIFECINEIY